jgi:hypothetical protein
MRTNALKQRIATEEPPWRTFWGQLLGTELVVVLPLEATEIAVQATRERWRTLDAQRRVHTSVTSHRPRPASTRVGRQVRVVGGRLPEQPTELRDRDAFTVMRVHVLLDPLAERQRRRMAIGKKRASLF